MSMRFGLSQGLYSRHAKCLPNLGRLLEASVAFVLTTACLVALPLSSPDRGNATSQAAADELAAKIALLSKPAARSSGPLKPVTISDMEANSYLQLRGQEFLPPAVHDPEIHILPDHIAGAADVDFNELGKMGDQANDWGAKLVAMVFQGKQRVQATGTLETGNGQGKFTLTSFSVGSTSLPAGFVNFLLQSYLEKQYKIDLSKPFQLPPDVSRIELGNGQATLLRSATSLSRR